MLFAAINGGIVCSSPCKETTIIRPAARSRRTLTWQDFSNSRIVLTVIDPPDEGQYSDVRVCHILGFVANNATNIFAIEKGSILIFTSRPTGQHVIRVFLEKHAASTSSRVILFRGCCALRLLPALSSQRKGLNERFRRRREIVWQRTPRSTVAMGSSFLLSPMVLPLLGSRSLYTTNLFSVPKGIFRFTAPLKPEKRNAVIEPQGGTTAP